MKSIIKLLLVVVLFCSTAFAEGDGSMGNGGRTCTGTNCLIENQEPDTTDSEQNQSDDSVLDMVRDYLVSIFG